MEEKIYVGSGTEKLDGNLISVSLCLSDLPIEHIFSYNEKKYIKLNIQKKKESDQFGKSHFVAVDTWKPEPTKAKPVEPAQPTSEDLPF